MKNIKIIETDEARFRIIYGRHYEVQQPEDLGSAEVLAIEFSDPENDYVSPRNAEKLMVRAKEYKQYKLIVEKAQQESKPIFFVDNPTVNPWTDILEFECTVLEALAGCSLFYFFAKDIVETKRKKISRREFFKMSIKGMAGAYLINPFFTYMLGAIDTMGDSSCGAAARFLFNFNERFHPETGFAVLILRNHLMAQKLTTIAKSISDFKGEKPEIGIVVGAYHVGIEKALRKSNEERIKSIDRILHFPGLKEAREKIAFIARLDFNKEQNKWVATEIFKDSYLATIENRRKN